MRATFHQLQIFEQVVKCGSFARAAERLQVAPPTVSMQIKQLAEEVGLPLFEQMGRKLFITDAGRELHAASRQISEAWSRFEMTVADMKGLKRGRLSLAVVSTAKYVVPRLLGHFCQRYPGIDVQLEVANRNRVLERLRSNTDDLYIMALPPDDPAVTVHPFLENPLVVVAPRRHPLAGRKKIALAQLAEERFLLREPDSGTRIVVQRFFDEQGFVPQVKLELSSNAAIKEAIAGGLGVSVLSLHALDPDPRRGPLTILDVKGFPLRDMMWSVVEARGKEMSVVAKAFYHYLKGMAKSLRVLPVSGSRYA